MRVLFLSRWFPDPPDNGSRIRVYNLLRQLATRHEVSLISFEETPGRATSRAIGALQQMCASVEVVPYSPYQPGRLRAVVGLLATRPRSLVDTYSSTLAAAVRHHVREAKPDLLITSGLDMIPYAAAAPGVPALLEELEVSTQYEAALHGTAGMSHLRARFTWLKLSRYLRATVPRFRACTVASALEAERVQALLPRYRHIAVVPNAVDTQHYAGNFGSPRPGTLVFSGALTYHANLDAAHYLVRDILPIVLEQYPSVRLLITGSSEGVPAGLLPLHPAVQLTGHVPDIRPVVAQSWVAAVPLRLGGGTRLKILEAMALGTPVVATRKGAEGLEVTDGENILLADTPRELAQALCRVMGSPGLRAHLAEGGRRLVTARYTWEMAGQKLRNLVEAAT